MSIINNVLSKMVGSHNERLIKKYKGLVEKINSLESQLQGLEDSELSLKTTELKERVANKRTQT